MPTSRAQPMSDREELERHFVIVCFGGGHGSIHNRPSCPSHE